MTLEKLNSGHHEVWTDVGIEYVPSLARFISALNTFVTYEDSEVKLIRVKKDKRGNTFNHRTQFQL